MQALPFSEWATHPLVTYHAATNLELLANAINTCLIQFPCWHRMVFLGSEYVCSSQGMMASIQLKTHSSPSLSSTWTSPSSLYRATVLDLVWLQHWLNLDMMSQIWWTLVVGPVIRIKHIPNWDAQFMSRSYIRCQETWWNCPNQTLLVIKCFSLNDLHLLYCD